MGNQSETKPWRERFWDVSVEVIGPVIYGVLGWMIANALTSIKWGIVTVAVVALLSIIAFYFLNRRLPKKGIIALFILPVLLIVVLVYFPITKAPVPVPESQPIAINQSSTGPNSPNITAINSPIVYNEKPVRRRLEGQQRRDFINAITPHSILAPKDEEEFKAPIIIASYTNSESQDYAKDFAAAFREAGWDVDESMIGRVYSNNPVVVGLRLQTKEETAYKSTIALSEILGRMFPPYAAAKNDLLPDRIPQLIVGERPEQ